MTTIEDNAHALEIISWAKKNLPASTPNTADWDFNKSLAKTNKQILTEYVATIGQDYQLLREQLAKQNSALASAQDSTEQQKKQLLQTQAELNTAKQEQQQMSSQISALTAQHDEQGKQLQQMQADLLNAQQLSDTLQDEIKEKAELLEKLSAKSMQSLLSVIPEWASSGTNWKEEYSNLEEEKSSLSNQIKNIQKKLSNKAKKQKKNAKSGQQSNAQLEAKIQELSKENERLLSQAAILNSKHSEQISDYEKRENYQVVKEYKEFCLHQGLDYLAEEILASRQNEQFDEKKYKQHMVAMKALLAEQLLLTPYQIQIAHLRNNTRLLDFDAFKSKHVKALIKSLDIPKSLNQELLKIAAKAFDLINELTQLTPPCQLLIPETSSPFSSLEHDVDDLYSKPAGIVKLLLAPGVYCGHEVLMKPVVYTKKK